MNKLVRQGGIFIGVSGIGWLLDFALYTLLAFCAVPLFWCNICGAFAGISFVFIFSTRYIFKSHSALPLWVKYVLYVLYQIVLVCSVSWLLVRIHGALLASGLLPQSILAIAAKILVTPITLVLNFLVLKQLIEKM